MPAARCRYEQDPITLQLKEYVSPEVKAARKAEAEAAEAVAKAAAEAEAKRLAEEEEAKAAAARAVPVDLGAAKGTVKLGLGKAKKPGLAVKKPAVGLFAAAVEEEPEAVRACA